QARDFLVGRYEIGGRDPDALLRAVDRGHDGRVVAGNAVVWRAPDDTDDLAALGARRRKEGRISKRRTALPAPTLKEQLLDLGDGRSLDLDVRIAPVLGRFVGTLGGATEGAALVTRAQVHSSQNGPCAIDDEDLAMVAGVRRVAALGSQGIQRI